MTKAIRFSSVSLIPAYDEAEFIVDDIRRKTRGNGPIIMILQSFTGQMQSHLAEGEICHSEYSV